MKQHFSSFSEFYVFYLSEHTTAVCRRLHFFGIVAVIVILIAAMLTLRWWLIATAPVAGYVPAWIGHAVFERNRPATLSNPFYSFASDWVMFYEIVTGKIRF